LEDIILKRVTKSDIEFLYELLKQRNISHNISHVKTPSLKQHIKFIDSKPYKRWYIIINNKQKIGTIYISKNSEVGIHFKSNQEKNKLLILVLKQFVKFHNEEFFYFNVSTNNKNLNNFFKENSFSLLQLTYKISKKELEGKW
jgi:hypothetical protein